MSKTKYIAFLRGINVGGHHKVPMADLREELGKLKFENVITILNTGNIIFDAKAGDITKLEKKMSDHLEKAFGFPIPTILRTADGILELLKSDPFKGIEVTKDIRLYVSFLATEPEVELSLPWANENKSYQILDIKDKAIVSVLDLSGTKTVKGMASLEKMFGKNITTRNWNTIKRVEKKLES